MATIQDQPHHYDKMNNSKNTRTHRSHRSRKKEQGNDDLEFGDNPEDLVQLKRLQAQMIAAAKKNSKNLGKGKATASSSFSLTGSLSELVENVSCIFVEDYYYEEVNLSEEHAVITALDANEVSPDASSTTSGTASSSSSSSSTSADGSTSSSSQHNNSNEHQDEEDESDEAIKKRIWKEHCEECDDDSDGSDGDLNKSDKEEDDDQVDCDDIADNNEDSENHRSENGEGEHTSTTAQETEEDDDSSEGVDGILDPYLIVEIPPISTPEEKPTLTSSWSERRYCRASRPSSFRLFRSSGASTSSRETRSSWLGSGRGKGSSTGTGTGTLTVTTTSTDSSGSHCINKRSGVTLKESTSDTQAKHEFEKPLVSRQRSSCHSKGLANLEERSPRSLRRVLYLLSSSNKNSNGSRPPTFQNNSDVIEELRAHRASMIHQELQNQGFQSSDLNYFNDDDMPSSAASAPAALLSSSSISLTVHAKNVTDSSSSKSSNRIISSSSSHNSRWRDKLNMWRFGVDFPNSNSNQHCDGSSSEEEIEFSISLSE